MRTLRSRHHLLVPFLAPCAVALVACGGEQAAEDQPETDTAEAEAAAPALPDTTAASLWSYLNEVDYQSTWQLWPDRGELYRGAEPHGMLLTTYLNAPAHEGLTGDVASLPNDAIVVKENYTPDSTLAAVTVMYKKRGYDPEHNDWFWVKYLPDGSVDAGGKAVGRVQGCIGCHGGAADNDYIMTSDLAAGGSGGS